MILVSTRYGSTAWNLSVGGTVNLNVDDCTHLSFVNAPLAHPRFEYTSGSSLQLEICRDALVGLDGNSATYCAKAGSAVRMTRSRDFLRLLRTESTYEAIPAKLKRQHEFAMGGTS